MRLAIPVNPSPKLGRAFVVNQAKYEHLNAFNALTDRNVFIDRTRPVGRTGYSGGQLPIAVKSNICTTEFNTTAASGILQDFKSPYEATVVMLLRQMRTVFVTGTTNMDEFGMGSHSTHSHHGPVKMQRYPGEGSSAGGSSGGSAMAVASAQCWAALGTDTGGSVRLPAAYTGVVGFKPSYGLISRRGVIAYANSLDTVGILGRTARDVESIFDNLNVHDKLDPTSVNHGTRKRLQVNKAFKKHGRPFLKIGIPLDYNVATLHPMVRKAWIYALKVLSSQGHTLHPVRLPSTQHALSAYYVIAPAEASSNLAKYDGVRYGSRAEGSDGTPESVLFAKSRGQGFGPEVQRRILLGAFSLSAQAIDNYFIQAQKVRRLIQQEFNGVFAKPNPLLSDQPSNNEGEKVDILLCPTAPTPAPSMADVAQQSPLHAYMNDVFTVPSSLAGLPAISVPVNFYSDLQEIRTVARSDKFVDSVGIQIIGQYADDKFVLDIADQLQYLINPPQFHGGYDVTAWGGSFLGTATKMDHARFANIATKLGVSLPEAAAHDAAYRKQRLPAIKDLLTRVRGREHIEKMARLCNTTPDGYVSKFLQKKRPLDAERNYSEDLLKESAGMDPQMYAQNSKLLFSAVGGDRIREAATLYGIAPRKYISKFVTEEDPVAAEAAFYRSMLVSKKFVPKNDGGDHDAQLEQKQGEPMQKPELEDFTISKIRTYELPDLKFKITKVNPKKGEPLVRRVEFDSGMKTPESK